MSEVIGIRLDAIAARARQLAHDAKNHKLWPGEMARGLAEMRAQIALLEREARDGRW